MSQQCPNLALLNGYGGQEPLSDINLHFDRPVRALLRDERQNLIVFDGDDTLWMTEHLYDSARDKCRRIVESYGLDGEEWNELERQLDVANVAKYGLSRFRFPESCIVAYNKIAGSMANDLARDLIVEAARTVFRAIAPLADGVEELLLDLTRKYSLVLVTQGDPLIQIKRINDSDLAWAFSEVRIVQTKSRNSFKEVLRQSGADPRQSWSIGNSFPSDVQPALEVGMNAIWIPTHVWEYEHRLVEKCRTRERAIQIDSLEGVRQIITM